MARITDFVKNNTDNDADDSPVIRVLCRYFQSLKERQEFVAELRLSASSMTETNDVVQEG